MLLVKYEGFLPKKWEWPTWMARSIFQKNPKYLPDVQFWDLGHTKHKERHSVGNLYSPVRTVNIVKSEVKKINKLNLKESQHWSAYKLCNLLSRAWILACREQNSNGNGKGGTYRSSCPAHCSLSGTNSSPANSLSQQHVLMASVSLWTILCSSHLKSVNTNTVTG